MCAQAFTVEVVQGLTALADHKQRIENALQRAYGHIESRQQQLAEVADEMQPELHGAH